MDVSEWLYNPKTVEKSKKFYAHFDYKTNITHHRAYITNPEKIAHHRFFPFIHYQAITSKFKKGIRLNPPKTRDICYAGHKDRCIYQYYSFLLNEAYNAKLNEYGINEVPVAYRTNISTTNIKSANKAIRFIRDNPNCHVMIGDFTHFFDELDHIYLKKRWCQVIGTDSLPADHYAVFKSITKYQKWELSDILSFYQLKDTPKGRKELNKKPRLFTIEEFRKYRKGKISTNTLGKGIPQGSPISAVLANVYMIEVDKHINDIVSSCNGLYMRYSDDFIIIIPDSPISDSLIQFKKIQDYFNQVDGLSLESSKTQYFSVNIPSVQNCGNLVSEDSDQSNRFINFLGFTFDGYKVSVRSKTTSKYYYRMNRKAKTIAKRKGYTKNGKKISCENLYTKYSHYGKKRVSGKSNGNFLTYIDNAADVFGENELIYRDTVRHMQKIRKALKKEYPDKNSQAHQVEELNELDLNLTTDSL